MTWLCDSFFIVVAMDRLIEINGNGTHLPPPGSQRSQKRLHQATERRPNEWPTQLCME